MTIDTTAPADTAEKSLREELQEQFTAAAAADDDIADTGSSAESRSRDDRGRFAGKTDAVDATIVDSSQRAPVAGETGTAQAGNQAAIDQSAQQPAVAPPPNLKPELRAAWDAAPPELRKFIADREAEVHKGFTRMDEERQFGKTMRETISPYAAMIQSEGGDPASAVKALLNTAYILRSGSVQQKVSALQAVAQQYGIPLENVQQLQHQQRVDPNVAALQQQVQQLTQSQQRQQQEREQAEQHHIQSTLDTFAAAPGHEHFEQVKPHMAALLEKNLANDLQDAYDQAVWARPDLRQTVLAAQQQTAKQAQATQAQARAAAAKQAAGSVPGAPGVSMPVGAPDRSLRDELRANLRAAQH
jgi:hypothetical protein